MKEFFDLLEEVPQEKFVPTPTTLTANLPISAGPDIPIYLVPNSEGFIIRRANDPSPVIDVFDTNNWRNLLDDETIPIDGRLRADLKSPSFTLSETNRGTVLLINESDLSITTIPHPSGSLTSKFNQALDSLDRVLAPIFDSDSMGRFGGLSNRETLETVVDDLIEEGIDITTLDQGMLIARLLDEGFPPQSISKNTLNQLNSIYDNFAMPNNLTNIPPQPTTTFLENLAERLKQPVPDYNLGYDNLTDSPIFKNGNYLAVKGQATDNNSVRGLLDKLCKSMPKACREKAFTAVYHGSSSPSLMGILSDQPQLTPLSVSLANDTPIFSASGHLAQDISLDQGTLGLTEGISTSAIMPNSAIDYSRSIQWSESSTKELILQLETELGQAQQQVINDIARIKSLIPTTAHQNFDDYWSLYISQYKVGTIAENQALHKQVVDLLSQLEARLDPAIFDQVIDILGPSAIKKVKYQLNLERTLKMAQNQLNIWPNLTSWQQDLVSNSFPVAYGLKPKPGKSIIETPKSDINFEIAFQGSFDIEEIQIIFVPKDKIDLVKKLWSQTHPQEKLPLRILDIELLNPNSSLNQGLLARVQDNITQRLNSSTLSTEPTIGAPPTPVTDLANAPTTSTFKKMDDWITANKKTAWVIVGTGATAVGSAGIWLADQVGLLDTFLDWLNQEPYTIDPNTGEKIPTTPTTIPTIINLLNPFTPTPEPPTTTSEPPIIPTLTATPDTLNNPVSNKPGSLSLNNANTQQEKAIAFLALIINQYNGSQDDGEAFATYIRNQLETYNDGEFAYLLTIEKGTNNRFNENYDYYEKNAIISTFYSIQDEKFQCADFSQLLEIIPGLNPPHISGYSITSNDTTLIADILKNISQEDKKTNRIKLESLKDFQLNRTYVQGEHYIGKINDYNLLQPGDALFNSKDGIDHVRTLISSYDSPAGPIFVIAEANSPIDGRQGTIQIYAIAAEELYKQIGIGDSTKEALENTLVVRLNTNGVFNNYSGNEAPQNILNLINNSTPSEINPPQGQNTPTPYVMDPTISQNVVNSAETIMSNCQPGVDGYYNACPGKLLNGEILQLEPGQKPNLEFTKKKKFDRHDKNMYYFCTSLLIDVAIEAGVSELDKISNYSVTNMYKDFRNHNASIDIYHPNQATKGLYAFIENNATKDNNYLAHAGIVYWVSEDKTYLYLIQANAPEIKTAYTLDPQTNKYTTISDGEKIYIDSFGDLNIYKQNVQ